jgi:hypothetical protein
MVCDRRKVYKLAKVHKRDSLPEIFKVRSSAAVSYCFRKLTMVSRIFIKSGRFKYIMCPASNSA